MSYDISIIVPVYNVDKYLKKCLDTILNQSFKNFELILVDDGSTDMSGKICDEYSFEDERIKVIHKDNGGLSSARNKGIENSKGRYIGFVDSDDFIDKDMYKSLYESIKKYDADISMCQVIDCYGDIPTNIIDSHEDEVFNQEQAIKEILIAKKASVWAVNKLYKREIFQSLRYPIGKITEDGFVILDILKQCEKVVLTYKGIYYYMHRNDSITTQKFSKKNLDTIEAWNRNYNTVVKLYPSLEYEARMRQCWANFNVLDKMHNVDDNYCDYRKEIVRFLRNNYLFIVRNKYFHLTRRISMIILKVNTSLYYYLIRRKK